MDIIYINQFYGTFTWDNSNGKWIETENSSRCEFYFPSTEEGIINNAKIVVTGIASDITYPHYREEYDRYTGKYTEKVLHYQLPEKLNAVLTVDNKEVGRVDMKATLVAADKAPEEGSLNLDLIEYLLEISVKKQAPNIVTAILKKGEQTLLGLYLDRDTDVDLLLEKEEANTANANLKIKLLHDLIITGSTDAKKIADALASLTMEQERKYNDLYTRYLKKEITWQEFVQAEAEEKKIFSEEKDLLINDNSSVYLISSKEESIIAKVKMKVQETIVTTYGSVNWDSEKGTWGYGTEPYTYSKWETVSVVYFEDDTAIEAAVYFGTGFEDIINKVEKFIGSFIL